MTIDYSDQGIYGHIDYGVPVVCKGVVVAHHFLSGLYHMSVGKPLEDARWITVGSGNGFEFVYLKKKGFDVHNLDLYIPPVPLIEMNSTKASMTEMPFEDREFDILLCTEVMEHIPLEETDKVLKECKRVANVAVFSIATTPDPPFDTHVNVQTGLWWLNRFKDLGFNLFVGMIRPILPIKVKGVFKPITWGEGVFIIAGC